ncbi:SDR family NAD(P)-dependent oxidoreductase [Aeromicrobium ginsengisoli]|uniref:SDR family NAD(P)-dependent oxidoreductase n=1 Tax=Aeromicrobium ginsengisoli TaxID=363867 RepID=A0A5M4FEL9_9ACTN|nr:SDR family NAD(P)-dependent oxidoreductase [Aeromicrobium ginsengisoli]KAA1397797.1 SDR family NAD(P)-dependent oxidoreductase [Aeromicrobium ginsengisoli]
MRLTPPRRRTYPLADKVVFITGAGRGLGAATATVLAKRGAYVVIADRHLSSAKRTAAALPDGRGLAVECDVTDLGSVRAAVNTTREQRGRIDVVIANAGILGVGGTLRASRPENTAAVMAVNVDGVTNTVAATIEDVIANRGQMVIISSVFAYINGAGAIPYAMSKAAVEQLGRGLNTELAMHGVSVMTAYFSLIETDMIRDGVDADPHLHALLSASPKFMLKRIQPERAAGAIVRGIEDRRRTLTVPGRWRPVSALRGIAAPILDAKYLTDESVQDALVDLETSGIARSSVTR